MTSNLKSVRGAGLAATIGLALQVPLMLAVGVMTVQAILQETALLDDRSVDLYNRIVDLALVQGLLTLATAVPVIVWLWRARTNADFIDSSPALSGGAVQQWGRSWVILGWIVPFLSLWVPRQVVGDIWRASVQARGLGLVNAWWALWLLVIFLGAVSRTIDPSLSVDSFSNVLRIQLLQTLTGIGAAIMMIMIVRGITRAQQGHAEHIARVTAGREVAPS